MAPGVGDFSGARLDTGPVYHSLPMPWSFVLPMLATLSSTLPLKTSAMPQAAKLSAKAPRKTEATHDLAYLRIS